MPTFDDRSDEKLAADTPVCRHMRTKALYVYGQDTPDAVRTSHSSGYQCLKTQFVTGPDQRLCAPEECTPGRNCFDEG